MAVLRPLLPPLLTGTILLGVFACAPIELRADGAALRDGGSAGPVADLEGGSSGSFADADVSSSPTPTDGFRAACGVISACSPDDRDACTTPHASDAGSASPDGDAGASGDAGDAAVPRAPLACRLNPARDATSCAAVGAASLHEGCATDDDCAAGLACAAGSCESLCCSATARCAPETACVLAPHTGQGQRFVPVCAPRVGCAFRSDDTCPPGNHCGLASDDGSAVCLPLGSAREGASCALAPCAEGLVCIGAPNRERCAKTCDPSIATGCLAGQRCRAHPALFGTVAVGYCSPSE